MMLARTLVLWLFLFVPLAAPAAEGPMLVILEETGKQQDHVPVLVVHPETARISARLSRGWSGHILRLYRWEQQYLHSQGGPAPEPAYLLLSSTQGGFPRYGFYLGKEDKRHAAYIDLQSNSAISGQWGSVDQLFPHELGHVLLKQLGPLSEEGAANQVHAIGVRTDPGVALDEGFGEHMQILALDDPDALPETRALLLDASSYRRTQRTVEEYRRELMAAFSPFARRRMTVLLWFSPMESVLRYYDVKTNSFAREAEIPEKLLQDDIYAAYLLENILPGGASGKPKSAARMLASEGVVSALLYRWASSARLQNSYRDDAFYAQFGAVRKEVVPAENYFLKLFCAVHQKKPQNAAQLAAAYKALFPDEADGIDAAIRDVFLGQALPTARAIWLKNNDFKTGTTLFDQFRGIPRTHTFDLNGASEVDLMSVPGMTPALTSAIRSAAPFAKLEDLSAVPGMKPQLMNRFKSMRAEMSGMFNDKEKTEEDLSIKAILYPYVKRMAIAWVIAGLAGALLYRAVRKVSWWRCALNGLGAALPALMLGWIKGGVLLPLIAPVLIFGFFGALWRLWRERNMMTALQVLAAWLVAAVPATALTRPWF